MKILHTSDWHVGRRFQGNIVLDHLEQVLSALAQAVADNGVEVVVIAGDVFDTASPSSEAYAALGNALNQIAEAGAEVVMTSGNHDSATRLGYLSGFTQRAGLHIITDPVRIAEPLVINDDYGPVNFFGIPFLEPALIKHLAPENDIDSQHSALSWAMENIKSAIPAGERSVVISHTFANNMGSKAEVPDGEVGETSDLKAEATSPPRDITAGGVDVVDAKLFDGITYTALGHLHSRKELSPSVRYSGAPLFYSFGERSPVRGAWLVEFDADGIRETTWVDLPIPRQVSQLTGELQHLLTHSDFSEYEPHWVKAVLTDNTRPIEAMRKLQVRFPYCAELVHEPANKTISDATSYSARIKALSDQEIAEKFLSDVRNGEGASEAEQKLLKAAIEQYQQEVRD